MSQTAPRTVRFAVHFGYGDRGRRKMRVGRQPRPPTIEPGRIPRISRLMALAIHFDDLIRQGVVGNYSDLARLGGVTRARITQVMALLDLAPDIQEAILFLPRTTGGRDRVTERQVRYVLRAGDWDTQRARWATMLGSRGQGLSRRSGSPAKRITSR
ncbi:MAG: hypothetical protein KAY32_12755 [Candidatus Eisenbacteria sp.]|nr:hypothetical protein [Candidatus Eisenbacteria bacterium]